MLGFAWLALTRDMKPRYDALLGFLRPGESTDFRKTRRSSNMLPIASMSSDGDLNHGFEIHGESNLLVPNLWVEKAYLNIINLVV